MRTPPLTPGLLLNLAGAVILTAGIATAFLLHNRAAASPPDDDAIDAHPSAPLSLRDSKKLSAEMERNWGSLGNLHFSGLGGERLPLAVLGLSAAIGLGCFFAADRLP